MSLFSFPQTTLSRKPGISGAIPFDVAGVDLGHHDEECSFEAIVKRYGLTSDPALVLLGKIVNGVDIDNTLGNLPEGSSLQAIAGGFRHLRLKDDHDINTPSG